MNTRINELVNKNKRDGYKALAVGVGIVLLAVIAGFTGYHNYRLFGRGLDQSGQLFALIPVLALEGGALWLLICAFAWFTDAKQKALAAAAEITLIGIIALNTIVDHNITAGQSLPDWLNTYRTFLTPAAPVAVFALVVLLFYLDPSKRRRDLLAALEMAEQERMFQAQLAGLSSDEVEAAYEIVETKISKRKARQLVDSVPTDERDSVATTPDILRISDDGADAPKLTKNEAGNGAPARPKSGAK